MRTARGGASVAALLAAAAALAVVCCWGVHAQLSGTFDFAPTFGVAPAARYQYGITLYQHDPVIFGGSKGNLRSGLELNDMWRWSTTEATWSIMTARAAVPSARWGPALATHGTSIFLFGGCNTIDYLNDFWRYDVNQVLWTQFNYPIGFFLPEARQAFGYFVRNATTLYVVGGIGVYGTKTDIWSVDLTQNSVMPVWVEESNGVAPSNPIVLNPKTNLTGPAFTGGKGAMVAYWPAGDKIIAGFGSPGSVNETVNVNYVNSYDFVTKTWTRVADVKTTDGDGVEQPSPRNLMSYSIVGSTLYLTSGYQDDLAIQVDAVGTYTLDLNTFEWALLPTYGNNLLTDSGAPDGRDSNSMIILDTLPPGSPVNATVIAFYFAGWGDAITNDAFLFAPLTGEWVRIQDFVQIPSARSQHSMVRRGSTFVIFGGLDPRGTLFSDLWSFETEGGGAWTQIIAAGDTPTPRKGHASAVIGDKLYIHGGTGPNGLLSDCWQFSFVPGGQWSQITYQIDATNPVPAPLPRENHYMTSQGLFLYIVAGRGEVEPFNDIQRLDVVTGEWMVMYAGAAVNSTAEVPLYPSPRSQFGGGTFIYPYPPYQPICETVNQLLPGGGTFANTTCYTRPDPVFENDVQTPPIGLGIVVWAGLNSGPLTEYDAYVFSLTTNTWGPQFASGLRGRSLPLATALGSNKFLSIGGSAYEDMVDETRLFDLTAQTTSDITFDEQSRLTGKAPPPLAGGQMVPIADSVYMFGGFSSLPNSVSKTTTQVPTFVNNYVWKLKLSPLCPLDLSQRTANGIFIQTEAPDCFMCAVGSYATHDDSGNVVCSLCPPGTYTNYYGSANCTKCAPGFYSTLKGSGSAVSCTACERGTFNNQTGASACMKCPDGTTCAAATIVPGTGSAIAKDTNFQAKALPSRTAERVEKQSNVLYGALGNIGLMIIILLIIVKVQKSEMFLPLDLYVREHRPLTQEQRIMKEWRTSLGGMLSLIAIVFVIYFIAIQSVVWIDNVRETRSLIPNLSAPNVTTQAKVIIRLTLDNYGDTCAAPGGSDPVDSGGGVWSTCQDGISLDDTAVFVRTIPPQLRCANVGPSQVAGVGGSSRCALEWTCYDCTQEFSLGSIVVKFTQPLSFATDITWNFTTSTGVPPDQYSSFASHVGSDQGKSFRGPDPSIVQLKTTRVIFFDATGADSASSGYQVELVQSSAGSQVTAALFQYARDVSFSFLIQRSETTFDVERASILSEATFIASLLGGISGVLGGVGALLGVIEGVQVYFAKQRALKYTNELGRKALPEVLPLEGKPLEKTDWVIASLFASVASRLDSWEKEANYVPPAPVPPPPPRSFQLWEWVAVLFVEIATYSIPLRILSDTTNDAKPTQDSYLTTCFLDLGRALFFMWMSSRLTGNAGFVQHYSKFDKLTLRALLYSVAYVGLILPDEKSAGGPITILCETVFNLSLMGHTRVMQKFHVWTAPTLFIYKLVRLYAPLLFVCTSGSYVVTAPDGDTKNLILLWLLFGIDFYNEAFVHVAAFVVTPEKKIQKRKLLAKRASSKRPPTPPNEEAKNAVGTATMITAPLSPQQQQAPASPQSPGSPNSQVVLAKLHAGRHSKSHSASSIDVKASISDHVPHEPEHADLPRDDLGIPGWLFGMAIVVEILSSLSPIAKVYDDSQNATTEIVSANNNMVINPQSLSSIGSTIASTLFAVGGSTGGAGTIEIDADKIAETDAYRNGVIATVILTWARTAWWSFISMYVLKFNAGAFARYIVALDFLTARTFIMQIAYTVNLYTVNTSPLAYASMFSDWVMAFVFTAYIRVMFKCLKWHSAHLLRLYKVQRYIAPIVCLSVGIAILHFPLYEKQPEAYLLYLVCAVFYYTDIVLRYWHVPSLDADPILMVTPRERGHHRPSSAALNQAARDPKMQAKAAAAAAAAAAAFDPRDTRPKNPATRKLSDWLLYLIFAVEILSSSSPIVRLVAKSSSEDEGSEEAQINSLRTNTVLCWARAAFWLLCSERQRGNQMWSDYFVIDNLTLDVFIQSIAYGTLEVRSYPKSGWIGGIIVSDFVMNLILAGHIRVMVKYFKWTSTNLYMYRLQRLYAPMLWLLVGVLYTWKAVDLSTKSDFVLYLLCGIIFLFDLYNRTTKVHDIAPAAEEDAEVERIQKYQQKKKALEMARGSVGNAAAAAGGQGGNNNAAALAAALGASPANSATVIELPSIQFSGMQAGTTPSNMIGNSSNAGRGSFGAGSAPSTAPAPAHLHGTGSSPAVEGQSAVVVAVPVPASPAFAATPNAAGQHADIAMPLSPAGGEDQPLNGNPIGGQSSSVQLNDDSSSSAPITPAPQPAASAAAAQPPATPVVDDQPPSARAVPPASGDGVPPLPALPAMD